MYVLWNFICTFLPRFNNDLLKISSFLSYNFEEIKLRICLQGDKIRKWRVENSWGDDFGDKGKWHLTTLYCLIVLPSWDMSVSWVTYIFHAVCSRSDFLRYSIFSGVFCPLQISVGVGCSLFLQSGNCSVWHCLVWAKLNKKWKLKTRYDR